MVGQELLAKQKNDVFEWAVISLLLTDGNRLRQSHKEYPAPNLIDTRL